MQMLEAAFEDSTVFLETRKRLERDSREAKVQIRECRMHFGKEGGRCHRSQRDVAAFGVPE
jgi:hypothetical protein